ncbi:MAG: hypothetical protein H0V73_06635 [Chloroflexi bacterium]|nr:hypothetical protein [Chloroflexota bacterium]
MSTIDGDADEILALGVAPVWRRQGLATRLLAEHLAAVPDGRSVRTTVVVAERDVVEPLDQGLRMDIARRLLIRAGFQVTRAPDPLGRLDPAAVVGWRA